MSKLTKGFKGFKCTIDGLLYCQPSISRTYYPLNEWKKHDGTFIAPCSRGFHYCENLKDTFTFYSAFMTSNFFGEIAAKGEIIKHCSKFVTDNLKLIRIIPKKETLMELGYRQSGGPKKIKNLEKTNHVVLYNTPLVYKKSNTNKDNSATVIYMKKKYTNSNYVDTIIIAIKN